MKTAIHSHCPVGIQFAHLQADGSACVCVRKQLVAWKFLPYVCARSSGDIFFHHFIFVKIHILEAGYASLIR